MSWSSPAAMSLHIAYTASLLGLGWLCWKLLRPFVTKSWLDNIPGPNPQSLLMGTHLSLNLLLSFRSLTFEHRRYGAPIPPS